MTVLDRLRDVEDREGVILMTVRRFVETMLRDRLRCPSTVLERYIMGEPRQYGFISGKELILGMKLTLFPKHLPPRKAFKIKYGGIWS